MNPYTGCSFACSYCYTSFMGRFVGETRDSWGDYVYVKTNAVELFSTEITQAKFKDAPTLFISSVTDAWQGPEKKYQLTRGILEVLTERKYAGRISILTKSPLIERDIELLGAIPNREVGMTITTDVDAIGALYEAHAPKNSERLIVLRKLNDAAIPTYAFVGPLMTHYLDNPERLDSLLGHIASTGVRFIYAELLNVSRNLMWRMQRSMSGSEAEIEKFITAQINRQRRAALGELVVKLADRHGLSLRLGRVLDHAADRNRRD